MKKQKESFNPLSPYYANTIFKMLKKAFKLKLKYGIS